jgi:hypothetical protein
MALFLLHSVGRFMAPACLTGIVFRFALEFFYPVVKIEIVAYKSVVCAGYYLQVINHVGFRMPVFGFMRDGLHQIYGKPQGRLSQLNLFNVRGLPVVIGIQFGGKLFGVQVSHGSFSSTAISCVFSLRVDAVCQTRAQKINHLLNR